MLLHSDDEREEKTVDDKDKNYYDKENYQDKSVDIDDK